MSQRQDWCCSVCLGVNSGSVTTCQACGISQTWQFLKKQEKKSSSNRSLDDDSGIIRTRARSISALSRRDSILSRQKQFSLSNVNISGSNWQCMACSCFNEIKSKDNRIRKLQRCQTCGTRQFSLSQLSKPTYNKQGKNDSDAEWDYDEYINHSGILNATKNKSLLDESPFDHSNSNSISADLVDAEQKLNAKNDINNSNNKDNGNGTGNKDNSDKIGSESNINGGNNNSASKNKQEEKPEPNDRTQKQKQNENENEKKNNNSNSNIEDIDESLFDNKLILSQFTTNKDFLLELSLSYLKFGNSIDIQYIYASETTKQNNNNNNNNDDDYNEKSYKKTWKHRYGKNRKFKNRHKNKNNNKNNNNSNNNKNKKNSGSSFYEILMSLVWTHKEFSDSVTFLNALIFVYKTVLELYSPKPNTNHSKTTNMNNSNLHRNGMNINGSPLASPRSADMPPQSMLTSSKSTHTIHGFSNFMGMQKSPRRETQQVQTRSHGQQSQGQGQAQAQLSKQNLKSIENFKKLRRMKRGNKGNKNNNEKRHRSFKFARNQFDFARIFKEIIKNWVKFYWSDDFQDEILQKMLKDWLIIDCNKFLSNSMSGIHSNAPDLFRDTSGTNNLNRGRNNSNNNNSTFQAAFGAPAPRVTSRNEIGARGGGVGGAGMMMMGGGGFGASIAGSLVGSIDGSGLSLIKGRNDSHGGGFAGGTYESEMLTLIDDFIQQDNERQKKERENNRKNKGITTNKDKEKEKETRKKEELKQCKEDLAKLLPVSNQELLGNFIFLCGSFTAEFIADQITYLNSLAFEEIDPREWFAKNLNEEIYPDFTDIVNQCNGLSYWIRAIILDENDFYKRVKLIKMMFRICDNLIKRNNYCSLFAVFGAMQSAEIRKLTVCHDDIRTNDKALIDKFDSNLDELFTMTNNMASYLMRIKLVESTMPRQPCIPYLGKFKGELLYTEEICKNNWNNYIRNNNLKKQNEKRKLINFERYLHVGGKIRYIQTFQAVSYDDIRSHGSIVKYFKCMFEYYSNQKNYDASHYDKRSKSLNKADSSRLNFLLNKVGADNLTNLANHTRRG